MLNITDHIPDGLLDADTRNLHEVLAGPTLIHLPGRRQPALFVSVLLHGNEDVGLRAVQRLLKGMRAAELPRALSIFIGNVAAARHDVRHLDGQPDYNRIWPGVEGPPCPERTMVATVVDEMRTRGVFASIDLHNNTGLNPHYACVTRLRHADLQLAALFSRTAVYFRRPVGVQTLAFAELCPSVTCECGKTGDASGIEHAGEYLNACLHLAAIPDHPPHQGDLHLFHTVATVHVPDETTFSFDGSPADLHFAPDLDRLNFRELPAGTVLARRRPAPAARLEVRDDTGRDITGDAFTHADDALALRRPYMPSMLTCDARAIRQDVLCYLMERYPLPG
jgi:hypothetical protein